jgi:ElaB/YqjD/DUF883 family membrane-anchored ribosome-binding protein
MTMPRDQLETGSRRVPSPPEPAESHPPDARAQIRDVKNQVVDQAKTSLRHARDSAASSLSDSRHRAAASIGALASAVRESGGRLRADNQGSVANLTETVADQVDRLASYLRDRDMRAVREDLEGFARRQPAIAIGVALAVGLLGARFIKSSQRSGGSDEFEGRGYGSTEYGMSTERGQEVGTFGTAPAGGFGVGAQPGGGYGGA